MIKKIDNQTTEFQEASKREALRILSRSGRTLKEVANNFQPPLRRRSALTKKRQQLIGSVVTNYKYCRSHAITGRPET